MLFRGNKIEEICVYSLTVFLENSINFVANSRKIFCYHFGITCIHGLFIFIIPGKKIIRSVRTICYMCSLHKTITGNSPARM